MKRMLVWLSAAAVVAVTGASSAWAEGKGGKADPDRHFVMKAATGGKAEVKLAQMALDRAKSADVKKFAQMMLDDHTAANQKLMSLVSDKGMHLPEGLDRKHQAVADKLSNLQGEEFDRAYAEAMVKDHEDAVRLFEQESQNGSDTGLKGFAEQTLPKLREHLKAAQDLNRNR